MVQEFDYCERCGKKKSIYTEIYKGKDLCKSCLKEAELNPIPDYIRRMDILYREQLKRMSCRSNLV